MEQKTAAELSTELNTDPSFVEATIGLDTGRLLKSTTHVYFIAPRMGGWEVIEQTTLSGLSKVERKANFMGDTFVFHTKSGRWVCKEVTENVDLRQWVLQKARPSNISSSQYKATSTSVSTSPAEQPSASRSNWEVSSTSVAPRATSQDDFFSKTESSTSSWLNQSSSDSFEVQEDLPEELQSVLDHVTTPPIQSVPPPVERNAEVDALLEKLASSTDEESTSGSSCGGTLVKLFIFIWIFGIFTDLC